MCQKVFSRKDNLREHLRAHAGQAKKKKVFECMYCNKEFQGSALLAVHLRTHTGILTVQLSVSCIHIFICIFDTLTKWPCFYQRLTFLSIQSLSKNSSNSFFNWFIEQIHQFFSILSKILSSWLDAHFPTFYPFLVGPWKASTEIHILPSQYFRLESRRASARGWHWQWDLAVSKIHCLLALISLMPFMRKLLKILVSIFIVV